MVFTLLIIIHLICRQKIDVNVHYAGHDPIMAVAMGKDTSFAFVTTRPFVGEIKELLKNSRDLDVLQESLGMDKFDRIPEKQHILT